MRYLIIFLVVLTSCSMYQKDFDCPPGQGIACTSVTTLEKMIIESPCGEDTFAGCAPKLVNIYNNVSCQNAACGECSEPFQRRIWITSKQEGPAYIYFQEDISCDEQ